MVHLGKKIGPLFKIMQGLEVIFSLSYSHALLSYFMKACVCWYRRGARLKVIRYTNRYACSFAGLLSRCIYS